MYNLFNKFLLYRKNFINQDILLKKFLKQFLITKMSYSLRHKPSRAGSNPRTSIW